jgi:hypothetical protein
MIAPGGAVAGPLSKDVLPQILAGGELGQDPFGAGSVAVGADVVGPVVVGAEVVGGAAVVVVGAKVVGGAVVVVGAVVVGGGAGAVVVVVGAGAVVVGAVEGVVITPLFATLKSARRLEVLPSAHVSTTWMLCDPSVS